MSGAAVGDLRPSASSASSPAAASPCGGGGRASISLRRATVSSQASGLSGTPLRRPVGERRREGLGQRVLGRGHVARARGEKGDELAVAAARDGVGRSRARRLARLDRPDHARVRYIAQTGRTSTMPWPARGQRAAQASAASRSGASIR